jgi:hypothetical protein
LTGRFEWQTQGPRTARPFFVVGQRRVWQDRALAARSQWAHSQDMTDTAYLRERGFRRWYERELTRGHLNLVLLLLSAVALMAAMEAISTHEGGQPLLMVISMVIAGATGVWSLRRYLFHLMRAELIAHQAVCPQCQTYGRWRVESYTEAAASNGDGAAATTAVRCAKCSHAWTIGW